MWIHRGGLPRCWQQDLEAQPGAGQRLRRSKDCSQQSPFRSVTERQHSPSCPRPPKPAGFCSRQAERWETCHRCTVRGTEQAQLRSDRGTYSTEKQAGSCGRSLSIPAANTTPAPGQAGLQLASRKPLPQARQRSGNALSAAWKNGRREGRADGPTALERLAPAPALRPHSFRRGPTLLPNPRGNTRGGGQAAGGARLSLQPGG